MQLLNRKFIFYLHIFVLSSFSIAPLYTILTNYAVFFVAHKSRGADIYIFTLIAALLIPSIAALMLFISELASKRAAKVMRIVILLSLSAMIFFPVCKKLFSSSDLLTSIAATILSLALTLAYIRRDFIKLILTISSPVIILFPIIFLFNPSIQKITENSFANVRAGAAVEIESEIPIIMLVFDELPLSSLMDSAYSIDNENFPNLSDFASKAHWFRNATTVASDTSYALPAILTGKYPDGKEHMPVLSDYPENLFTLLAGHYEITSFESNSNLCPIEINEVNYPALNVRLTKLLSSIFNIYLHHLLPNETGKRVLPVIDQGWQGFDEKADFDRDKLKRTHNRKEMFLDFVGRITDKKKPQFYYLHTLLPHHPWLFYPSGNTYNRHGQGQKGIVGLENDFSWPADADWQVLQAYQRHLLQMTFVDKLFGKLIKRLKDTGLYERSLIIVTADHGVSFRVNDNMRSLTKTNYLDIMRVPLFIKTPHQKTGTISERNAELIDIVPTITEALNIKTPWKTDGASLFDNKRAERENKVIFNEVFSLEGPDSRYVMDARLSERFDDVERKLKIFSDGFYKIGEHKEIIGRSTKELWQGERSEVKIEFRLQQASPASKRGPILGGLISGEAVNIAGSNKTLPLALAIDGKIRSVTETLRVKNSKANFSFLLPEVSYKGGQASMEIFVIDGLDKSNLKLTTITRRKRAQYSLNANGDSINSYDEEGRTKTEFPIKRGASGGVVETILEFEGSELHIVGWAADRETRKLPKVIMGLVDGKYAFHIKTHEERPDIAERFGLPSKCGFDLFVPAQTTSGLNKNSALRLFAIFEDSSAIELTYPEGALVITGPVEQQQ